MFIAPGGYLAKAPDQNPEASAMAFTVPELLVGHDILLPLSGNAQVQYLDITMLAADIDVTEIPDGHPDRDQFHLQRCMPSSTFDLVICDGQVLRTHERAECREKREAERLTLSQLAAGLEHIERDGTMMILLHKVEAWPTLQLLYQFSTFAIIRFSSRGDIVRNRHHFI
jgi:hypothetical protein